MQRPTLERMDLKTIFGSSVFVLLFWCLLAVAVTIFGYPGVVCITPFAWLLALNVGQSCIHRSKSNTKAMRIREATYAGGILGLGEGIIFSIIALIGFEPSAQGELPFSIFSSVLMTLCGTLISAMLAAAFANYIENKQAEISEINLELSKDEGDNNDK